MADAKAEASVNPSGSVRRPGRSLTLTAAQATVAASLLSALSASVGTLVTLQVERQKSDAQIRIAEMNASLEIKKQKDQAELEIKRKGVTEGEERKWARDLVESALKKGGIEEVISEMQVVVGVGLYHDPDGRIGKLSPARSASLPRATSQ